MLVVAKREWNEWPSSKLEEAAVQFLPDVVVPNVKSQEEPIRKRDCVL